MIGSKNRTSKTIFKNIFIPIGSLIIKKVIKALKAEITSPATVYIDMIKLLIFIDSIPHAPDCSHYILLLKNLYLFSYVVNVAVYPSLIYLA